MKRSRSQPTPLKLAVIALAAIALIGFVILLPPYLLHTSAPVSGIVTGRTVVEVRNLPKPLGIYFEGQSTVNVLLLSHVAPEITYAVLGTESFESGTLVAVEKELGRWYVNWGDIPLGERFDVLVIADVVSGVNPSTNCAPFVLLLWPLQISSDPEYLRACIETEVTVGSGYTMLLISTGNFYAGPLLPFILTYLYTRKIRIWSLICTVSFFSAEYLVLNILLSQSGIQVPLTSWALGSGVPIFAVLTYLMWKFEKSEHGQQVIRKIFSVQRRRLDEHAAEHTQS